MRTHGTLVKWNDARGFGFVAMAQGQEEVFVHISAFPKDGIRPRIGEMLSFEVRSGADGRKKAEAIQRPMGSRASAGRKPGSQGSVGRLVGWLIGAAAVLTLGLVGYNALVSRQEPVRLPLNASTLPMRSSSPAFSCDGRSHCSQMRSCEEARYFLQHCPGVQMDGDRDGVPCERQWCE